MKANADKKEQPKPKGPVCCRACQHSNLMQYDQNPVLAACKKKPNPGNERFPFDVDVASSLKNCSMHAYQDPDTKQIEHRTHHTMSETQQEKEEAA